MILPQLTPPFNALWYSRIQHYHLLFKSSLKYNLFFNVVNVKSIFIRAVQPGPSSRPGNLFPETICNT